MRAWPWILLCALVVGCAPAPPPAAAPAASGGPTSAAAAPTARAAPATSPPAPAAVKMAFGSNTAIMLPIYAAASEGFFARHGIEPTLSYVQGSRIGVPAVMSGELEVLQTAGPAVIAAQLGGGDIVWVADLVDKLAFSIVAEPSIRRPEDFRGKKLAVTGVGTSSDTAARLLLTRAGLQPGEDTALVNAGGMAEIVTLLQERVVDGGVTSFPTTTEAKRLGYAEIVSFADLDLPYPFTGLAVRQSWATANRDVAVRVMAAFMEATAALKADKALAVRVASRLLDSTDTELLSDDYDGYSKYFRDVPLPSARTVKAGLDEIAQTNPAAASADPARLYDASFVEAAASGRGR
ncbi:MAG TPA: ABC transporter substrate-binding protein [Chloroflexota bacterium]|nr:ABC transporter substrate-binding protein [Chloroflexota bacterium]